MDTKKILSIMPYVLGVLILILVAVIILTGTAGASETGSSESVTPTQAEASGETKEDLPGPTEEVKEEGKITDTPAPTQEAEPTAEVTDAPATPTPEITDLTYGYTFEEKSDYVDTKVGVNLRTGASTDSERAAFLKDGARLKRTGYNKDWTRVEYEGATCYIATYLIVRVVETIDAVVATPTPSPTPEPTTAPENGGTDAGGDLAGSYKIYGPEGGKLIVVDAGHQSKSNTGTEPIGPGAEEQKIKVSSGTQGVSTGTPEYKLNLTVALKLKEELIARGYRVLMIRETHDVNITNSERAVIANTVSADAYIRIHANGSENSSAKGMLTICQTPDNPYSGDTYKICRRLSDCVLNGMKASTGGAARDVWETDNQTGHNWSRVPMTTVEMGFMTNPEEDVLMATDDYQNRIVDGIADGLDEFFSE